MEMGHGWELLVVAGVYSTNPPPHELSFKNDSIEAYLTTLALSLAVAQLGATTKAIERHSMVAGESPMPNPVPQ
jgi:hypothetical protein